MEVEWRGGAGHVVVALVAATTVLRIVWQMVWIQQPHRRSCVSFRSFQHPTIHYCPVQAGERKQRMHMVDMNGGDDEEETTSPPSPAMEIGWPTDVRHVTFDRFHGFRGVPAELQPEVDGGGIKAPSASRTVFGVSTESMQCSYDARGNSVPTILLQMQRRLYGQGGLAAEGIFRIAADDTQEQLLRDQLNAGVVPEGVDVHCLAGLTKAWFRELPGGVLPADEVTRCQSEEDCARLCARLPPPKAAILDWAVNLMADVAEQEKANKMSTRNVAMVFAPNMTQALDPLTALKDSVQVMKFLNMLTERAIKQRGRSS